VRNIADIQKLAAKGEDAVACQPDDGAAGNRGGFGWTEIFFRAHRSTTLPRRRKKEAWRRTGGMQKEKDKEKQKIGVKRQRAKEADGQEDEAKTDCLRTWISLGKNQSAAVGVLATSIGRVSQLGNALKAERGRWAGGVSTEPVTKKPITSKKIERWRAMNEEGGARKRRIPARARAFLWRPSSALDLAWTERSSAHSPQSPTWQLQKNK
jgi:hypothetical protein